MAVFSVSLAQRGLIIYGFVVLIGVLIGSPLAVADAVTENCTVEVIRGGNASLQFHADGIVQFKKIHCENGSFIYVVAQYCAPNENCSNITHHEASIEIDNMSGYLILPNVTANSCYLKEHIGLSRKSVYYNVTVKEGSPINDSKPTIVLITVLIIPIILIIAVVLWLAVKRKLLENRYKVVKNGAAGVKGSIPLEKMKECKQDEPTETLDGTDPLIKEKGRHITESMFAWFSSKGRN